MVATWSVPVLRFLTKLVGVVLIVLGIVGVVAGDEPLLGLVNLDTVENVIHLITGGLLLWAGFAPEPLMRQVVGTLGVLSLGAGILGFVGPNLFGSSHTATRTATTACT